MDLITVGLIAQTIGSILLLGGYAPQIIKLHKTKIPTGISVLFWVMIAIGCTSILINMHIQDSPKEVQFTQLLNAIGAWYTLSLVMYCRHIRGEKTKMNRGVTFVFCAIFIVILTITYNKPIEQFGHALQVLGTVALLTAYLPQIIHLYKVKDATGISRWLYVVLSVGLLCVTVNMIITNTSIGIIITEFVNIALLLASFAMTVHYQNKK